MNLNFIFVMLIAFSPLGMAHARICDSKNTEFISSRPELACMACEMEYVDADFEKEKAAEYGIKDASQLKILAGPSDRYWALMSVAVRQFYSKEGEMTEDEFKMAMIRVVTAAGPCRDFFYDPNQEFLQQLKQSSEISMDRPYDHDVSYESGPRKSLSKKGSPAKKGSSIEYQFPDLQGTGYDLSPYATKQDPLLPDVTWKDNKRDDEISKNYRLAEQPKIAAALGFSSYKTFVSLMNKPKLFDFMSNDQLRSALKANFDNIPSSDKIFNDKKEGSYLRSCVKQIQTNLKGDNFFGPKAGDVCTRLTRSCFTNNTESYVAKVCSDHGLNSSKSGSIGGGGYQHSPKSPPANESFDGKPALNPFTQKPGKH